MKQLNIFCPEIRELKNRSCIIVTNFIKPWVSNCFTGKRKRRNDTSAKYWEFWWSFLCLFGWFFLREGIACFNVALWRSFLTVFSHGIITQMKTLTQCVYSHVRVSIVRYLYLIMIIIMITCVTIFTEIGQFLFPEVELIVV